LSAKCPHWSNPLTPDCERLLWTPKQIVKTIFGGTNFTKALRIGVISFLVDIAKKAVVDWNMFVHPSGIVQALIRYSLAIKIYTENYDIFEN